MLKNDQQTFILSEIFAATLGATVQHSKTYADNAPENERRSFQRTLRQKLEDLAQSYESPVSEAQHISNIEKLADDLSIEHASVLVSSRFRIGSAQKALNLYLKYLWCLGRIERPPHCPIDAFVLAKLPSHTATKWTALDKVSEYEEIIAEAKLKAGSTSLSEWELALWNRRESEGAALNT